MCRREDRDKGQLRNTVHALWRMLFWGTLAGDIEAVKIALEAGEGVRLG